MNYQQVCIAEVYTFHFWTRVTSFNNTVLAESLAISFLCVQCTADCMRLITQAASQCVACSRAAVELSVAARHPPFGPRSLLHLHHLLVHHLLHLLCLHHHSLHHQQQQKGNHHHHQNNNNKYLPSFSEIILITSHPPLSEASPEKKQHLFRALPELGGPTCPNWRWHFLFVEQKQK